MRRQLPASVAHATVALLVLIFLSKCTNTGDGVESSEPGSFTLADFNSLAWLEGTWRGAAEGGDAFYEGYRLVGDSTVEIEYFSDSSLTRTTRTGSVYFDNGVIYHREEDALWAAVRMDTMQIAFGPVEVVNNSFVWTYRSPESWTAKILDSEGQEAAVFWMERMANKE